MATDDREKYRAHEFWRFRAQASQTPAHPTEADRRARIESQKTSAFVAAIRPQLRAARQTLSRSDMAALQRGVVRLHRRGQTVEQVSEFVDAFTANPAAFRDRFPEPPPIDPHNHQLKPNPPSGPEFRPLTPVAPPPKARLKGNCSPRISETSRRAKDARAKPVSRLHPTRWTQSRLLVGEGAVDAVTSLSQLLTSQAPRHRAIAIQSPQPRLAQRQGRRAP